MRAVADSDDRAVARRDIRRSGRQPRWRDGSPEATPNRVICALRDARLQDDDARICR
jgi:hypothetical protein